MYAAEPVALAGNPFSMAILLHQPLLSILI